jgi:hypothetical protein
MARLKEKLFCAHCGKQVPSPEWPVDEWPDVLMLVHSACGAPLVWRRGGLRIITPEDEKALGPKAWAIVRDAVIAWQARKQ